MNKYDHSKSEGPEAFLYQPEGTLSLFMGEFGTKSFEHAFAGNVDDPEVQELIREQGVPVVRAGFEIAHVNLVEKNASVLVVHSDLSERVHKVLSDAGIRVHRLTNVDL